MKSIEFFGIQFNLVPIYPFIYLDAQFYGNALYLINFQVCFCNPYVKFQLVENICREKNLTIISVLYCYVKTLINILHS